MLLAETNNPVSLCTSLCFPANYISHMVQYGVVLFSVELCGSVWSCVVRCGVVWFGVELCGVVCVSNGVWLRCLPKQTILSPYVLHYCVFQPTTSPIWFSMELCCSVWSCVVQCGVVWSDVELCGSVWSYVELCVLAMVYGCAACRNKQSCLLMYFTIVFSSLTPPMWTIIPSRCT